MTSRWAPLGVFPTAGGLSIVVDGQMIGAIGVGGGSDPGRTTAGPVVGPAALPTG